MEQATPKAFKHNVEVRYFILISTLLTWAHTKPLSPDEPDLPFTEEDYKKRKPHPNFKKHIQCEKDVVMVKKKLNLKDKLKTVVICSAATYGDEEGPLHHLFRMAWKNAPFLPIFGRGNNKIPLLHVRDLIAWVWNAFCLNFTLIPHPYLHCLLSTNFSHVALSLIHLFFPIFKLYNCWTIEILYN